MSDYSNTCPQCGSPVPADARFCENCGASFPGGAAAAAPQPAGPAGGYGESPAYEAEPAGGYGGGAYGASPEPGYNPAAGPEAGYGGAPDNGYGGGYGAGPDNGYGGGYGGYGAAPVKASLPDSFAKRFFEDFCGSPLFLTFTILVTTKILFDIFANIFNIFSDIPTIIITVALWLLFANSKTHNFKSGPLSLIRGSLIAQMVLAIIGGALIIICGIFGFIGVMALSDNYYSEVSSMSGLLIAICLIIVLVGAASLIVSIFFYRSLMGTTASIREMLESGHGSLTIPHFARVLFIIQIVLNGLGLIGTFIMLISRDRLNAIIYDMEGVPSSMFSMLNIGGSGFTIASSIFASMLGIAILVIALIIIFKIEATPFEGGYDTPSPVYNEDPWNGPAAY